MSLLEVKLFENLDFKNILGIVFLVMFVLSICYLVYFMVILIHKYIYGGNKLSNKGEAFVGEGDIKNGYMDETRFHNTEILSTKDINGIDIGFSSVIGTRKYQQDSIIVSDETFLKCFNYRRCIAALCDGMGGMEGGEIASSISVKTIYEDYVDIIPKNVPEFFEKEVSKLDKIVSGLTNKNNEPMDSGTTLISVIIECEKLYWVSVGDSHIYIIRKGEMVQVSKDHNYYSVLKERAENGLITADEAAYNPRGEALTSFIGIGRESEICLNEKPFDLMPNDIIILCSDGLYKTVTDQEIHEIVSMSSESMASIARRLTTATMNKKRKNQDNTSVILIKYNGLK